MEFVQRLIAGLFPSRCIMCVRTVMEHAVNQRVEICSDCYQDFPHNNNCCSHCALPLPDEIEGETLCGGCIKKRPNFDYSYSLFRYEDEIIKLVHQIKFGEKITYTRSIGELLLNRVNAGLLLEQGRPECIIPVPLHNGRIRKRGYNQATEISRVVAEKTGLPIEQNAVIRRRATMAQTGLDARERQKNIKGVFKVVRNIEKKHVLVIDDVVTTGSTVNELARVLKRNGVERVGVLSIARAPMKC